MNTCQYCEVELIDGSHVCVTCDNARKERSRKAKLAWDNAVTRKQMEDSAKLSIALPDKVVVVGTTRYVVLITQLTSLVDVVGPFEEETHAEQFCQLCSGYDTYRGMVFSVKTLVPTTQYLGG